MFEEILAKNVPISVKTEILQIQEDEQNSSTKNIQETSKPNSSHITQPNSWSSADNKASETRGPSMERMKQRDPGSGPPGNNTDVGRGEQSV